MVSDEKERKKKREYMRAYYAANKNKYCEQARKYRATNLDKVRDSDRERGRKRRAANPDKFRKYNREYQRQYRATKPEKDREAKRKYRLSNPDKVRESVHKWQVKHPDVMRANAKKRRASLMTSVAEAPTVEQIATLMKDPCVYCGDPSEHMDHVIPLARGGTHEIDNLVPACKACNLSKGSKLPVIEWFGRKKKH